MADEEIALLSNHRREQRSKWKTSVPGILVVLVLVFGAFWMLLPRNVQVFQHHKRAPLNFLALGDWGRLGMYNQSFVAKQMGIVAKALDVDFVVSTGDNFYKDGLTGVQDPAFDASFSRVYTARSLQKPWYLVLGNHDYHGDVLSQLDPALKLRDWRWNCKREGQLLYKLDTQDETARSSLELLLDESSPSPSSLELFFIDTVPFVDEYWLPGGKHQFDWRGMLPRQQHLKEMLQNLTTALKSSTATWKIVVGHHTIRSYGNHGETEEMIRMILPILEANSVDIYLNGHDHCLEHIKRDDSPIHFITSGGGSKAWKGILPAANSNGLQFYYDGQGFVSISVASKRIHVSYYDLSVSDTSSSIIRKVDRQYTLGNSGKFVVQELLEPGISIEFLNSFL